MHWQVPASVSAGDVLEVRISAAGVTILECPDGVHFDDEPDDCRAILKMNAPTNPLADAAMALAEAVDALQEYSWAANGMTTVLERYMLLGLA